MKKIVMYSVEVIVDGWGNFKKGDKLKMEGTTARACQTNGVVKILEKKGKDITTKTRTAKKDDKE